MKICSCKENCKGEFEKYMKEKHTHIIYGRAFKRAACMVLAVPLMVSAVGCSKNNALELPDSRLNKPISRQNHWFASSVAGGIDKNLQVSPKDDYF